MAMQSAKVPLARAIHLPIKRLSTVDDSLGIDEAGFLQARCPSCCPTNSIKDLKEHIAQYSKINKNYKQQYECTMDHELQCQ